MVNKIQWIVFFILSAIWSLYFTLNDKLTDTSNMEVKPLDSFTYECKKKSKSDKVYFYINNGFLMLPLLSSSCEQFFNRVENAKNVRVLFSRKGLVQQLYIDGKEFVDEKKLMRNHSVTKWGIASFGYIMLILSIIKLYQMHRKKKW